MSAATLSDASSQMRAIGTIIANIADTDATVLIRGESGVGKDDVDGQIDASVARGRKGHRPLEQPAGGLREIARRAAREAERQALQTVLDRVHWNRFRASRILKVSYKTLLHKIVDCELTPPLREQAATPGAGDPGR